MTIWENHLNLKNFCLELKILLKLKIMINFITSTKIGEAELNLSKMTIKLKEKVTKIKFI